MRIRSPKTWIELTQPPQAWRRRCSFAVMRSAAWGVFVVVVATIGVAAEDSPPKFVGSSSCATAACHGGLAGRKIVGAEHPRWVTRDPHARAYSVLLDDLSKQMAAQLKLSNNTAHESAECLICHSPATIAKESTTVRHAPQAGVDCEQCHGAAEYWLTPHKWKDWKTRPAEEKQRLGYNNLADVLTRAKLCTECHVGGHDRDVNHNLIAAGHPRLNFELSTFHANWPKHWPRKTDDNNHPVSVAKPGDAESSSSLFEAKLWAVGQVVTAQRSLELLSHRATKVESWPEFAEWNCSACHHEFESSTRWQTPVLEKRSRDAFGWNSWPYAMLEPLARQTRIPDPCDPLTGISKLRPRFKQLVPPAKEVAADAAAAAKSLQCWAELLNEAESAKQFLSPSTLELLKQSLLAQEGQQLIARDWDSATQVFLSINALRYAEKAARGVSDSEAEASDSRIQETLDAIQTMLEVRDVSRSRRHSR